MTASSESKTSPKGTDRACPRHTRTMHYPKWPDANENAFRARKAGPGDASLVLEAPSPSLALGTLRGFSRAFFRGWSGGVVFWVISRRNDPGAVENAESLGSFRTLFSRRGPLLPRN